MVAMVCIYPAKFKTTENLIPKAILLKGGVIIIRGITSWDCLLRGFTSLILEWVPSMKEWIWSFPPFSLTHSRFLLHWDMECSPSKWQPSAPHIVNRSNFGSLPGTQPVVMSYSTTQLHKKNMYSSVIHESSRALAEAILRSCMQG